MAFTPYNPSMPASGAAPTNSSGFTPYDPSAPAQPPQPAPVAAPKPDLLTNVSNWLVSHNVPGAQYGKALGGTLQSIAQSIKERSFAPLMAQNAENNANYGKVVGDVTQMAALPATLVGGGATIPARIGIAAGENAAFGAGNAAAGGGNPVAGGIAGGVTGGVGAGAGELFNAAINGIPNRLVRGVLPKLAPGTESDALSRLSLGSVASNLSQHQAAVKNLGEQIQTILNHPTYAEHVGNGVDTLGKVVEAFPMSKYTPDSVAATLSSLVPENAKIVDKLQEGTATLAERNTLRQALDQATKKRFAIDPPQLTAAKRIGAQVADTLRNEVQSHAPETKPIFGELSKELNLRNALNKAQQNIEKNGGRLTFKDLLSYLTAGLSGVVGERVAGSPGVSLAAAKGIKATQAALPAANAVGRAARTATIPVVNRVVSPPRNQ